MFLFISEIKKGTVRITNVRIICQLCDQIADTFCRCFVTGRFVNFTSILINEHPATTSGCYLPPSPTRYAPRLSNTCDLLQPPVDDKQNQIGLDCIHFPLIVAHFDECFGQELWFSLSDGHGLSGVHTIGTL